MGYTQAEMIDMGDWHWNKYGKNESRRNTPFKTELPGERTALPNPTDIANFEASVRRGDPSAMWTARSDIDPAWNLGQFAGQGWNFDPDNPYRTGILGDTIGVDTGVGQIWSEGDPRFLQDRYVDAAIANDFPVGWVGEEGTWKGPDELAGYWSDVTNAIRNEAGDLRAIRDRPSTGWAGTEILDVGPRWSGNVRPGVGVGNVYGTGGYTQPAPLDWSAIRPEVSYTPQFEALTGNLMSNWQPWATGQATPPGLLNYQIPGVTPSVGTSPNVTYTGGNPSLFNTDTSGSAFASGSTTTDTSGTKWVMTPGGQWVRADSDYGQGLLGTGRLFYDQHYDSSGAYVGSEGEGVRGNVEWGGGPFSQSEWATGNLDPISGQVLPPGVTQDAQGNRYRTDEFGNTISMGNRRVGLKAVKGFTDYMSAGGPFAGFKSIFDAVATPSVEAEIGAGTGVDTTGVDTGYGGGYGWT